MHIKIRKKDAVGNKEITEYRPFGVRRIFDKDKNFVFNPNGIFSKEIFGRIGKCNCKNNPRTKPGMCKICKTEIVDRGSIPDYYITAPDSIPFIMTNYSYFKTKKVRDIIKNIMEYNMFYYDGELFDIDDVLLNMDGSDSETKTFDDMSKFQYGKDAIMRFCIENNINLPEEWYEINTIQKINIPHPIFRPIIKTRGTTTSYTMHTLNEIIQELLKTKEILNNYCDDDFILNKIVQMSYFCQKYNEYCEIIFDMMAVNNKNIKKQEIIAQKLSSAARGVLCNRYDLDEDIISIPPGFIKTLYPSLYYQYDGNMKQINSHLIKSEAIVFFNRPPTIGQKSIIGLLPRIEMNPMWKYTIGINPINFDGISGDTDGDVVFISSIFTEEAKIELQLLLPSNNYRSAETGSVRNKIPEDFLYVMHRVYLKHPDIKAKIVDMIGGTGNIKEDLYTIDKEISREKYMDLYRFLGRLMWKYNVTPTIGDIIDHLDGKPNENYDIVMEYTGNIEKVEKLLNKQNTKYTFEESNKYINDVISANVTEITQSGWMYKKIMASCDDIQIEMDDCGSEGEVIEQISHDKYTYMIKNMWVKELNRYCNETYKDFKKLGLSKVTIMSPKTCNCMKHRRICKKCAGNIQLNDNDVIFIPKRFGIFSTLMVTEYATQGSLDSMNKGSSENINTLLEKPVNDKNITWDRVKELTDIKCNEIGNIGIQKRFFEIVYMSRFHNLKNSKFYTASSMQHSIAKQNDPLSIFIYSSTYENFKKMIKAATFDSNSTKSKIMFDFYE